MNINLKKKNVLVTGGSGGIGSEIVNSIHSLGANILISGSNEQKLENFSNQFNPPLLNYSADLSKKNDIEKLAERTLEKFDNKLDILINNAGITKDNILPRMKEDEWLDVIQTNLTGSFYTSQRAIKQMMKNKWGRIIFISSVVGISGNQGQSNYAASKAGLIGLAKSISKELGSRNITSNVIAPGYIETDMTSFLDDGNKENIIEQLSIKRIGKPEDISNVVAFLCNDESEYITGQVIPVDGGLTT